MTALRIGGIVSLLVACPTLVHAQVAAEFAVHGVEPATFVVARARPEGVAIEGFVVDRDALVETLRTRVLEEQGLGQLARVTGLREPEHGKTGRTPSESLDARAYRSFVPAYAFQHRFAAPFQQLEARLDLAPLHDEGNAGELLYPLTAALALAIVLGLYALYRMVAVQVRFAERRSNFVAAVSHELKTPLTAIRMYGEMLRDDLVESEEKRHEYYATISSETERLTRLINNVLELARLERDERPMSLVVGDVAPVVREVLAILRPQAEREGFVLVAQLEPGLPAVRFDRDALTQVLFNLVDNALKYGRGAGECRIVVRTGHAQGGVVVSVVDAGKGVENSQLAAIFEPFYRAQSELTRTQQGTGIGLSLVQGLVTRMEGKVEGRNLHPGFEVSVHLTRASGADRERAMR